MDLPDGSAIRSLRDRLGCDQEQFARVMGVSTAALSRWENDRAQPTGTKQKRLAALADRLEEPGRSADRLRLKLLLAGVLADPNLPPVELLRMGALDSALVQGFDDQHLLEELYLLGGLDGGTLVERKCRYLLALMDEGALPVNPPEAWRAVLRTAGPLVGLGLRVLQQPGPPGASVRPVAGGLAVLFAPDPMPDPPRRSSRAYRRAVADYPRALSQLLAGVRAYRAEDPEAEVGGAPLAVLWTESASSASDFASVETHLAEALERIFAENAPTQVPPPPEGARPVPDP